MDLGSGGGGRGGVARGQVAVRQNIATFFLPPSLPSFLRYRFTFPANRARKEKEGRGGEEFGQRDNLAACQFSKQWRGGESFVIWFSIR